MLFISHFMCINSWVRIITTVSRCPSHYPLVPRMKVSLPLLWRTSQRLRSCVARWPTSWSLLMAPHRRRWTLGSACHAVLTSWRHRARGQKNGLGPVFFLSCRLMAVQFRQFCIFSVFWICLTTSQTALCETVQNRTEKEQSTHTKWLWIFFSFFLYSFLTKLSFLMHYY